MAKRVMRARRIPTSFLNEFFSGSHEKKGREKRRQEKDKRKEETRREEKICDFIVVMRSNMGHEKCARAQCHWMSKHTQTMRAQNMVGEVLSFCLGRSLPMSPASCLEHLATWARRWHLKNLPWPLKQASYNPSWQQIICLSYECSRRIEKRHPTMLGNGERSPPAFPNSCSGSSLNER